jgi:hypothetical protein
MGGMVTGDGPLLSCYRTIENRGRVPSGEFANARHAERGVMKLTSYSREAIK